MVLNTRKMAVMGNSDGTGASWRCETQYRLYSWARWPHKPIGHIEWAQGHVRHSIAWTQLQTWQKASVHIKMS